VSPLPAPAKWFSAGTGAKASVINLMPTSGVDHMLTTINIDDKLLAKATKLMEPMDQTTILNAALKALIERESANRLAKLGGTQPQLKAAPRRR
jgi:Arc/MetJ family transcription regulator